MLVPFAPSHLGQLRILLTSYRRFHISQDRYQLLTVAKYDENHLKHPSDKEHNMQPIITVSSGLQPTSMTFEHMIAVDEQPKNVLVRF